MPVTVFTPSPEPPRIQNQPLDVFRVASWEQGLEISPPSIGKIPFTDVIGMAVYRIHMEGREQIHVMLFVRDRPRPLYVDEPGKIQFQSFAALGEGRSGMDKFRQWAILIARLASRMLVDRGTAGFLKEGKLAQLERKPMDLVASFVAILGRYLGGAPPPVTAAATAGPGTTDPPASSAGPPSGVPPTAVPPMAVSPAAVPPAAGEAPGPKPAPYRQLREQRSLARPRPSALPLLEGAIYPVRAGGRVAFLLVALFFFSTWYSGETGQIGVVIFLAAIQLWYVPSLAFAIIRHAARVGGALAFPKVLDLDERFSDMRTALLMGLSAIVMAIVPGALYLSLGVSFPSVPWPWALAGCSPFLLYIALLMMMALGAVGAFGDRRRAFGFGHHHRALRRCAGPAIRILLVSLMPLLVAVLGLLLADASFLETSFLLYGPLISLVAAFVTVMAWYLLGSLFRVRRNEMEEIYR